MAGPPVLLAILGLAHPRNLTYATAATWHGLHIMLLPIFPLLALAPWLIVRDEHRALRWSVATLGYAFAALYTALDVLAGIGAGALQQAGAPTQKAVMYTEGNNLADYGVRAYLAATVLAAAVALLRSRLAALPGAALVITGAVMFLDSHIFWPSGGLSMLALAIGWTALLVGTQTGAPRNERALGA